MKGLNIKTHTERTRALYDLHKKMKQRRLVAINHFIAVDVQTIVVKKCIAYSCILLLDWNTEHSVMT